MKKISPYTGEDSILKLLNRYDCPNPFHVVRATMMGEIVGQLPASPMATIRALWDDTLPEFETEVEAQTFFDTLLGLWNHLTKHQSRHRPFTLTKWKGGLNSREEIKEFCTVRLEEFISFYRALSQGKDEMHFPSEVADDIKGHLEAFEEMIEYLEATAVALGEPNFDWGTSDPEEFSKAFDKFDKTANKTVSALVWSMSQARKIEIQKGQWGQ